MDLRSEVERAAERVSGLVRETPLESSPALAGDSGARVRLKLENLQRTGSFKLRGATNAVHALAGEARGRGVVTASTGNHGAAVACAAAALGARARVFAPEGAAASKLQAIMDHGAEVVRAGSDCVESEVAARAEAERTGAAYVSPYNDPLVVAGQGTLGLELARQADRIDALYVAVGGGGLISGVGGYLKAIGREVEVIGVSPRNSCVMHDSLAAGRILDLPSEQTLSDGTAGGVEPGSITFELCRAAIDRFVLVSEDEIAAALRLVIARHHTLIEGAAAAAVAGFLAERERQAGREVAVVLCGANIDLDVLGKVLS